MAFVDRGDGGGEPLGLLLRSGNAAASTIADNADVLEQALQWLPAIPDGKPVVARGDSAMATCGFVSYARAADVAVSVSLPIGDHPRIQAAIHDLHRGADEWTPAVRPDGQARDGAHAAELADVPLYGHWPAGLWIIVRREPLHPGAQQTFADIDGHRLTAVLTDLPGDPVALDAAHRARARIEDRIRDARDTLRHEAPVISPAQLGGTRRELPSASGGRMSAHQRRGGGDQRVWQHAGGARARASTAVGLRIPVRRGGRQVPRQRRERFTPRWRVSRRVTHGLAARCICVMIPTS